MFERIKQNKINIGLTILRLALAGVFLWFGISQLLTPADWVSFVPPIAGKLSGLSLQTLVIINGIIDTLGGALLALGLYTSIVGVVMSLHLLGIAWSLGYNAIAIRDTGLALATLAIAVLSIKTRPHF